MTKGARVEKEIQAKELKESFHGEISAYIDTGFDGYLINEFIMGRSVIDRYCVTFDHEDRVIEER